MQYERQVSECPYYHGHRSCNLYDDVTAYKRVVLHYGLLDHILVDQFFLRQLLFEYGGLRTHLLKSKVFVFFHFHN